MVKQLEEDKFSSESITRELAGPALESGVHLLFDLHDRTFQALPEFLAENGYKDISDSQNGIFQKAFGTDLACYEYLALDTKLQGQFQDSMALHSPTSGDWLSALPGHLVEETPALEHDPVLFVDIGGGMGHQSIRLRERYPNAIGRVILQDMQVTIDRISKPMPHGVEAMVHGLFDPQPVKGAKLYYLRNVLHGLPDRDGVTVLENIRTAMSPESRLVIDDIVVPGQGASREICQLDFIMMASIAGKKRTKGEWQSLLDAAGYKIVDICTYDWVAHDSLIIASL
ncbi:hypothetical protein JDV02_010274 [Purpureocillium takamizusanense]|uniref:O-methyltransferase C-terminal domain-containing protein n=1 Tax=Purpureocillium takamizusanense TaxID=2060973 RepID=A0A9Q8QQE3_9HYPO|nr:uncharacterized protein JDV02_010274 [Purpureocillium takamizusanense]UNI24538.1 hypothetical protein JDV02_010274 [Purpureocillium takamizusanense]